MRGATTPRSGALRVRVYAGIDPVTKKRHNLIDVVPPGPKAWRAAEKIRDRFLHEVAERRNPRTSATVDQLLGRYLDEFDGAPNTLTNYRGYGRNHVSLLIGQAKVGELDADVLDSFYAELRRCRQHCSGRRGPPALDRPAASSRSRGAIRTGAHSSGRR